jgi:hypothetical protein
VLFLDVAHVSAVGVNRHHCVSVSVVPMSAQLRRRRVSQPWIAQA